MSTLNCLIVDDEELARNLVEAYTLRIPYLTLVGKCANPLEALTVLQEKKVDLIFLDIQMPELTGLEFLRTLPQKPLVILTTAYKEYAMESYELDVVDYLLKPFRFQRFLRAVNKANRRLRQDHSEPGSEDSAISGNPEVPQKSYVLVRSDFKVFRIFHEDILYIESMREYVTYHTRQGKKISLGSLKKLQQDLPAQQFIRIHKSYIANIDFITALEGNLVHIGKEKLPIGSSYKEDVLKRVF